MTSTHTKSRIRYSRKPIRSFFTSPLCSLTSIYGRLKLCRVGTLYEDRPQSGKVLGLSQESLAISQVKCDKPHHFSFLGIPLSFHHLPIHFYLHGYLPNSYNLVFVPDYADSSDVIIVRIFFSIDKDVELRLSSDIDATAEPYKG